jgi:hypothetical protein
MRAHESGDIKAPLATSGHSDMTRAIRPAVAVVALCLLTAIAAAQDWSTYSNPRFGTSAEYPANEFRPLPPPENGDGQSFAAADGATLSIFGAHNIDNDTPSSYEQMIRGGRNRDYANVTYRAAGADWLVLSGYRDDSVFYEKYIFADGLIHGLTIVYPRSAKAHYDPIAARAARSLGSKAR